MKKKDVGILPWKSGSEIEAARLEFWRSRKGFDEELGKLLEKIQKDFCRKWFERFDSIAKGFRFLVFTCVRGIAIMM